MRAVASPFCAVCRRVIRQTLQPFLARITGPWVGVQHRSTIAAGQTVRFFTFDWPACWHVAWTVVPTTPRPGAPQIRWRVQVERATHDRITYWIPVTNLTGSPVGIELRYELLATTFNWPQQWHVLWTVVPVTPRIGAPQIEWDVAVERASAGNITYWITIRNLTPVTVTVEGRYAILN
jgi:hypothetical protein